MGTVGKIILAIAAVIVILLIIAVINAIRIKAKPVNKKTAAPYTKDEENKYARILSDMIKVPTVSAAEGDDLSNFDELHRVMAGHFPLIFEKLEKVELDGNLLFKWEGKNKDLEGILLMGHQDVVPAAEKNWEHDPFSGDIENGKIHGRGAMDCKCTVMAEFAAVEELLSEGFIPERDVYLACSVNEEISGGGAEKTIAYLKNKGVHLASVMDEGGAIVGGILPGMSALCAAVGVVEKGSTNIKFKARGNGGHSSTPPKHTPIARLSKFVCKVEKKNPFKAAFTPVVESMFKYVAPYLSFPLRLLLGNMWLFKPLILFAAPKLSSQAEAFFRTTVVFTQSGGSKAPNVIPDEAYVIANIRPSIQQSSEECIEILRKMAEKYDIEAEVLRSTSASKMTPTDSDEFKYVEKCVAECCPQVCFTPYYMTGGTDCRKYYAICDNCLRFCPIRMDNQQMAAMHAANENINSDAVAEGVKFYKYYIKNHK